MITLRPITAAERHAYHRFRHSIYANSRVRGFIDPSSKEDRDIYDEKAIHLGWFPGGELKACVRLVEPTGSAAPLPMCGILDDYNRALVEAFLSIRAQQGHRLVEASRLCLAPEHRSLRNAMHFVMAIVQHAHEQGIDHGIFDMHRQHRDFYLRMGFLDLEGSNCFSSDQIGPTVLMTYDHAKLMANRRVQGNGDRSLPFAA